MTPSSRIRARIREVRLTLVAWLVACVLLPVAGAADSLDAAPPPSACPCQCAHAPERCTCEEWRVALRGPDGRPRGLLRASSRAGVLEELRLARAWQGEGDVSASEPCCQMACAVPRVLLPEEAAIRERTAASIGKWESGIRRSAEAHFDSGAGREKLLARGVGAPLVDEYEKRLRGVLRQLDAARSALALADDTGIVLAEPLELAATELELAGARLEAVRDLIDATPLPSVAAAAPLTQEEPETKTATYVGTCFRRCAKGPARCEERVTILAMSKQRCSASAGGRWKKDQHWCELRSAVQVFGSQSALNADCPYR